MSVNKSTVINQFYIFKFPNIQYHKSSKSYQSQVLYTNMNNHHCQNIHTKSQLITRLDWLNLQHANWHSQLADCFQNTAFVFNLHGIVPVSYTHLDVYKRQVLNRLLLLTSCFNRWTILLVSRSPWNNEERSLNKGYRSGIRNRSQNLI